MKDIIPSSEWWQYTLSRICQIFRLHFINVHFITYSMVITFSVGIGRIAIIFVSIMHSNILHYLHIAFHRLDMPNKFRKVQKYLDEVKIPTFKLKLMINDEAMTTFPTANLIVFYVLWRNAWHGKFRYLSNAYNTQTISISSFDCFIIINASANTM